ncbi:hypothetical protein D9M70_468600 [compost metagenome]
MVVQPCLPMLLQIADRFRRRCRAPLPHNETMETAHAPPRPRRNRHQRAGLPSGPHHHRPRHRPACQCRRRRRRRRLRQDHPPADSVPVHLLPAEFHRPLEHRLRAAPDEDVAGPQRRGLRTRCGHVLHRLCAVRGAEQHAAAPHRRAGHYPAHHGAVGPGLHGDHVRSDADPVLRGPFPAGRVRSRLLSRHRAVPDVLVSVGTPHARAGAVHYRTGGGGLRHQSAVRMDPQAHARPARLGRLAVDVPDRRHAHRAARHAGLRAAAQRSARSEVALRRRARGGRTCPAA